MILFKIRLRLKKAYSNVKLSILQQERCGSRRVYSYTKQDRSCDEGTSVYAMCSM